MSNFKVNLEWVKLVGCVTLNHIIYLKNIYIFKAGPKNDLKSDILRYWFSMVHCIEVNHEFHKNIGLEKLSFNMSLSHQFYHGCKNF